MIEAHIKYLTETYLKKASNHPNKVVVSTVDYTTDGYRYISTDVHLSILTLAQIIGISQICISYMPATTLAEVQPLYHPCVSYPLAEYLLRSPQIPVKL